MTENTYNLYERGLFYYLDYLREINEGDLADELNLSAAELADLEEAQVKDIAVERFNCQWKELSTAAQKEFVETSAALC